MRRQVRKFVMEIEIIGQNGGGSRGFSFVLIEVESTGCEPLHRLNRIDEHDSQWARVVRCWCKLAELVDRLEIIVRQGLSIELFMRTRFSK
jgi:hypothetical protein